MFEKMETARLAGSARTTAAMVEEEKQLGGGGLSVLLGLQKQNCSPGGNFVLLRLQKIIVVLVGILEKPKSCQDRFVPALLRERE